MEQNSIEPINNFQLELHGNKRNERNEMYRKRLNHKDVDVFCHTLLGDTFVVHLDIGFNEIGDEGAIILGKFLLDNKCFLQGLNLRYNDIGPAGCQEIAKGLQMNETLRSLGLDGNKFGNVGGLAIAGALQVNYTLEELNLNDTDLTNQSIIAFTTVLKANNTLKVLNLSRPLLKSEQEETTIHLAKMLEVNQRLEEIHLSKHRMTNDGVQKLIEHVIDNRLLLHLDLSCNSLSRDGVKCIAQFLKTDPPLKILNLGFNRAEDQGVVFLSEALAKKNFTLATLILCSNSLTDVGLCSIAKTLHTNNTLIQLYIWGNKIGKDASTAFKELTEGIVPRLAAGDTDVRAYVVDDVAYLAQLASPYYC